jgi:hypothetical protein
MRPVRNIASRGVRAALRPLGLELVRTPAATELPPDYDDLTREVITRVQPHTLTTHERIAGLVAAVRHVTERAVPGAFVECGVWRGGSALAMATTLLALGDTTRDLWLYDTFWLEMPPGGAHDRDVFGNTSEDLKRVAASHEGFRNGSAESVRALVTSAGYPADRVHIVEGLVEDTIPDRAPEEIALCRLDTDFYESTAHELRHLCGRLGEEGILIIDDYGHFLGARQAVDEYFDGLGGGVLFHRLDFSARLIVMSRDLRERISGQEHDG